MTLYFELRCDVGKPDDPFACDHMLYGRSVDGLLALADEDGWTFEGAAGENARCPDHQNQGDTSG